MLGRLLGKSVTGKMAKSRKYGQRERLQYLWVGLQYLLSLTNLGTRTRICYCPGSSGNVRLGMNRERKLKS